MILGKTDKIAYFYLGKTDVICLNERDRNINFGSVYENAVAQELVAHGLIPYYYNNKKRGELDFVIELDGRVLPIEVKSGKYYEAHRVQTQSCSTMIT